jgi:hypothetical protein
MEMKNISGVQQVIKALTGFLSRIWYYNGNGSETGFDSEREHE